MRLEPALSERKAEQLAGINNSTLTIESCRSGLKRGHQISGSMNVLPVRLFFFAQEVSSGCKFSWPWVLPGSELASPGSRIDVHDKSFPQKHLTFC